MCLARNYTTHWRTRPEKTKRFAFDRQSAKHVRARQCSTVPQRPSPPNLNLLVCSAVVGKYRCTVPTALGRR